MKHIYSITVHIEAEDYLPDEDERIDHVLGNLYGDIVLSVDLLADEMEKIGHPIHSRVLEG